MPAYRPGDLGFLDEIRIKEGNEACRAAFGGICERDKRRAALLLNDRRLTFPCLFILLPQIAAFGLERDLSPRNSMARRIAGSAGRRGAAGQEADILSERRDAVHSALKWMLETGRSDDGIDNDYEEVLDVAVSVLTVLYKDMSALPAALDLIFSRNRKERNIHNLVWAAFQMRNPYTLRLIARRILSPDEPDARLACGLLGVAAPESGGNQKRYDAYLRWLKDNEPFLYFTGESLQMSSRPEFCRVDMERKYIHRSTPADGRQPAVAADETESRRLAAFNTLGQEEKKLLSEYSHQAYKENHAEWKRWMQRPIDEQISIAKLNREVFNDYDSGLFV